MKITATDDVSLSENERVIGYRVNFGGDRIGCVAQRIATGAMHLRDTAQRVLILHLAAIAMRFNDFTLC